MQFTCYCRNISGIWACCLHPPCIYTAMLVRCPALLKNYPKFLLQTLQYAVRITVVIVWVQLSLPFYLFICLFWCNQFYRHFCTSELEDEYLSLKKCNSEKGLIHNGRNSATHQSWSKNDGFKGLYKPFYDMLLMGLHFVQVPEYLYWVIVHSICWWQCWTSQPDGEGSPICTPREELSEKEGLQDAALGLLSSREPGSSSTNKLRAMTDALCAFSVWQCCLIHWRMSLPFMPH